MKKFLAIISAPILVLSLCACSTQSTNVFSDDKQAQNTPEETQLSYPNSETEVIRPVTEASLPAVEATNDTRIAVDFIRDFYETLVYHDEGALDLDKYFDEGELKERMGECKKTLLEKTEPYEKDYFALDYVTAVSDKASNGFHLITVDYSYHFRYSVNLYDPEKPDEGWSGAGMRAPFVIRDGKIVNFAVGDLFEPLPADENVPEAQIILSHITAVQNGSFELDGVTYERESGICELVIEDGGFIRLVTHEGVSDSDNYGGETDELISAVGDIFTLECLGNTGWIEAGDIVFDDAMIYQFGEKLLVVGEIAPPDDFDMDLGRYCNALLFAPVQSR